LISGSGRGIGRATAIKLALEGASVVVNDLDEAPAQETVAEIRKLGGKAQMCNGSVTEDGFAERFVETALTTFGGLDIIVNNAGYTWDAVIQKMTDEQFDAIIDIHLKAPFRILRAAAEPIREAAKREAAQGREVFRKIVNISSVSGVEGMAGQVNYSTAKAGITGMTKALAKEWGRYKVNVNAVAFGYIQTRLTKPAGAADSKITIAGKEIQAGLAREVIDNASRMIPLGRGGTPEEAAGAIYLLCAPESDYISGHVLMVTGGA
jgi:3-oxoacyl-[acyl-carrier protein] reductase